MSTGPNIESKPSPRLGVPTLERHRCFLVRIPGPDGLPTEIDLTKPITTAIAHELWNLFGGNSVVNWIQAEAIVDHLAEAMNAQSGAEPVAKLKPGAKTQTEAKPALRQAA